MIITVTQGAQGQWYIYNPNDGILEYDAIEMGDTFSQLFETDSEDYIYIRNLDNYFVDIIHVCYIMGLEDVTADGCNVKDMGMNSYQYLVSDDGKCFAITIDLCGTKKYIRNFESLIPIKKDEDLVAVYPSDNEGPRAVVLAMWQAILDIGSIAGDEKIPMTISSLAYNLWKTSYHENDFFYMFKDASQVEVFDTNLDEYLRPSYHGGWCFLNMDADRRYSGTDGVTLDVNSLYSFVMTHFPLPYGIAYTFKDKIPETALRLSKEGRIYYFVHLTCKCRVKEGHFPCIQPSNVFLYGSDWLESSYIHEGEIGNDLELTLTMTDYELLLEHYDVEDLKIIDGVYFRSTAKLFNGFVDRFYNMKKHSKTKGSRKIAKILLNSLSGNMAKRRVRYNMVINPLSEDIFADRIESEVKSMSHVQIGSAITSYARAYIIGYAHKYAKQFVYSDTDSLHLIGTDFPEIPISDNIGDFKIEHKWNEAIFYTKKIYAERMSDNGRITDAVFKCSGLDGAVNDMITDLMRGNCNSVPQELKGMISAKESVKLQLGLDYLEKMEVPFYLKSYSDFTYEQKLQYFKIHFHSKQPKTNKILNNFTVFA